MITHHMTGRHMMSDDVTSTIVNQIGVIGYWGIVMSVIVTGVHRTGGGGGGVNRLSPQCSCL